MIGMSQHLGFYLLIFGVFPLLLASRSYIWGRGGYAFLNHTNIEVIKGLSMLWIIVQSLSDRLVNKTLISMSISKSGVLGVTLFLFCCGFEAMMQYRSNRRYLKGFIFHQIIRILFVFLFCNVIGTLINIYRGGYDGVVTIFKDTLAFRFSDGTSASLIGTLLYFYLAFYISYRTKFKMNLLVWMSITYIAISLILKWNASIAFCFCIGVFTAQYKKYIFKLLRQHLKSLFFMALFTFSSVYFLYLRGAFFMMPLLPYLFLILIFCVLMKLQCRSRFFMMIGSSAIELYLIHELLLLLLFSDIKAKEGLFFVLFWVLAIIGALFLKNVSHQMFFVPNPSPKLK